MKNTGIVLIVIGLALSLFSGFTLITKKKVVDLGKVEINREEKTPIYWNPAVGLAVMAVGVVVFIAGRKK